MTLLGGGVGKKESGVNVGPLFGDIENAREILGGDSINIQGQPWPWVGGQYITDFKHGKLWGPTIGTTGGSFTGEYGFCGKINPTLH